MTVQVRYVGVAIGTAAGTGGGSTGPPDISPDLPTALSGQTIQFFDVNGNTGTWSVAGTDASGNPTTAQGSIDGSGLYTAPGSILNKQTAGGLQLLPNNHIYNLPIDTLPVHADSTTWINGAGSSTINYLPFAPINYADGSTPTETMHFFYTSANDGTFQIPAYPDFRLEHGWFSARTYDPFNTDHHSVVLDTDNSMLQEMYQYYPAGSNGSCAQCTSQSGVRYNFESYDLPSPTTDAAGLLLWPLTLRLQELEQAIANAGEITHALRFTLQSGFCASSFIWPATTFATDGGTVPFGARARLKSSYNISGFSSTAQIILTQLKKYGIILADGGTGWQPSVEDTRWPKAIADAFNEIQTASIGPSNFQFVDESGLMLAADSGETTALREIVTFTRNSDSMTSSTDVKLQGVAVSLPYDVLHFMAGAAATQLSVYVNTGSVTWSMSPSVGTLTSGGLYTPPATATTPTNTTITATSDTDGTIAATCTLTVYANTTVRLLIGQTSNYTDSGGNTWYSGSPDKAANDGSNNFGSLSAYGYDNGGSWSGTDIQIYKIPEYCLGDMRFDFIVPNGTYTVVGKFANNGTPSQGNQIIEVNGSAGAPVDIYALAGGTNLPWDITNAGIVVSDGQLSFILRAVNTLGNGVAPFISGLQITKTA